MKIVIPTSSAGYLPQSLVITHDQSGINLVRTASGAAPFPCIAKKTQTAYGNDFP
jgi:hypothetical protein